MSQSFTSDELIALAKFPFNDPDWKTKALIGSLLFLAGYMLLFPLVFVYGYSYQIMDHIIVKKGGPYLPEWDDWGKLFSDGLKILGLNLLYGLPLLVLFCGGFGLFFGTIIASESASREAEAASALLPLIGITGWFCTFGLVLILALVVGLVLPAATGHMIAHHEFAAAFRVREWWPIFKANLSGFLIAFVLVLGFWMALNLVMQVLYFTIIFCFIQPFVLVVVATYVLVISSVLFAQAYQAGVEKLNSTIMA